MSMKDRKEKARMLSKRFVIDRIKRFNANTEFFLGRKWLFPAWIDYVFSYIIFGAGPDDYYRYDFYRKSWRERNTFITYRRGKKLAKQNKKLAGELLDILNDKSKTNLFFSDCICREWIDLDMCSAGELTRFVTDHERAIFKPKTGSSGIGIFILSMKELKDANRFLADHNNYIAEEVLIQHPEMSKLNSSCINTIRFLTYRGNIISGALKVGGGERSVITRMMAEHLAM